MIARLLLAPLALVLLVLPVRADQLSLNEISRYLNGLQTATADFTQINPDGTISTGELFIRRPGRMRFEYEQPDPTLVMAGGGQVAIFDGGSNIATPEQYPLARTPLNIILERNVDLSRRNMVTGHSYDGTATTVRAQDPQHPEYGSIELKFTDNPVELRQWIVTDSGGNRTTVSLGPLSTGANLSAALFNIPLEIQRRGR
ncbi:LolA family protein [Roseitranquillus sediminis]|uniref:LolA family protein n=1 Tax=Roseitranquillus sediminis TaxID=2809051 RepID=UPI001D0C7F5C|nr:outer membrane lipoprotein carrier protein LolA [Roseitranquillus sediminis]MBM9593706.1 outer membrane lipoprotein carrier protein LolA [Roseitranquillus sediminis]